MYYCQNHFSYLRPFPSPLKEKQCGEESVILGGVLFCFEMNSFCVVQVGPEFVVILLPQFPK